MGRIIKAVPVSVYRHGHTDCTNGGVSSKYEKLLVECPDGYIDIDMDNPPKNFCVVERRRLFGGRTCPKTGRRRQRRHMEEKIGVLISEETVMQRIKELASIISSDYEGKGE